MYIIPVSILRSLTLFLQSTNELNCWNSSFPPTFTFSQILTLASVGSLCPNDVLISEYFPFCSISVNFFSSQLLIDRKLCFSVITPRSSCFHVLWFFLITVSPQMKNILLVLFFFLLSNSHHNE